MDGAQAGDRCPTTDVIMSQCVGGRGGCDAAFGVSLSESASGADLGGSSKYSNENFEGWSGEGFHVNSNWTDMG